MPAELTPNQLKWVEALESREYKQGTSHESLAALDADGNLIGYCCLGVACEVAIKGGVDVRAVPHRNGYRLYDSHPDALPPAVSDWLGIRDADPMIGDHTAIARNDARKESFAEIAAAIREHGLS